MTARNTKTSTDSNSSASNVEFLAKTTNFKKQKIYKRTKEIDVNFSLFILIYFRCDNSQPKLFLSLAHSLELCFYFVIAIA